MKESTNYVISTKDFSSVNEEAISKESSGRTLDEKFFPAQETSESEGALENN